MKKKLIAALLLVCILVGSLPAGLSALAAKKVYILANTIPVFKYETSASRILGTMSYGESLYLLSEGTKYSNVQLENGTKGYVRNYALTDTNPNRYSKRIYINASNVPVYKQPDTSASVMMKLSRNSSFTCVAITTDDEWVRLKNGSYYGYVQSKYISTSKTYGDETGSGITGGNNGGSSGGDTGDSGDTAIDPTTVYVSDNTLKVYSIASTGGKVLGTMAYGESMTQIGLSGEWAQVKNSAGAVGYCKESGLTTENPNDMNSTAYITADRVYVYQKPIESARVLKVVNEGDKFPAVAVTEDGEWVRLKNGSAYGYVKMDYVSDVELPDDDGSGDAPGEVFPPVEETPGEDEPAIPVGSKVYVVENTLTVYSIASTRGKNLGSMSFGESMTLLDADEEWARVKNSAGAIGYCATDALSLTDPNILNEKVYINADKVYCYQKPLTTSRVLKVLSKNSSYTAVTITLDGEWVRLKNGSVYGYVQSDYVSMESVPELPDFPEPEEPETPEETNVKVYVTTDTLPVYASANSSAKKLGTMSFGETMTMLSVSDGWAKVQNTAGAIGYCLYGSLSITNPCDMETAVYTQESSVKLYAKPLTSAKVVKTVGKNTAMTMVGLTASGAWARVYLGSGTYAYVQTQYIDENKSTEDNGDIQDITARTAYVSTSATNLTFYASNSTSSASLGTLSFGESVTCTGEGSGWTRAVNAAGDVGYCKTSGLTTTNPNSYNVTLYAQADKVKIYKKASTASDVLSTVAKNTQLTGVAISADQDWIRLKTGSGYGYVMTNQVDTGKVDSGTSSTIQKVIELAKAQTGKKYVYAASGPNQYDCSGLTYYCFKQAAGITLKRTSEQQGYDSKYSKITSVSSLKIGDLVFFNTNDSDSDACDHVGIYLGSGNFIHASSAGGKVMTSNLTSGYYQRTFSWGRRIL